MSIGGNADEKLRLLVVAGKGAVFGWRGKIQNLYESKQKPLPKSSNPLKGLNNLFISYEKQNTKEAYNSNGNLERV